MYLCFVFFFFNDTATTEIYTLSLHDALPIYLVDPIEWQTALSTGGALEAAVEAREAGLVRFIGVTGHGLSIDRKSTRLNSSHANISYAVFCLKKKNIYYM